MKKLYSATTGGFYPEDMRSIYEAAGSWPSDGVEITADEHAALIDGQAEGKIIVADSAGRPVLSDPPSLPYVQIASAYLGTVRAIREDVLNRISGIGFAALASGDTATAQAIVTARQSLLDITKAPAVLAANDADSLKSAVIATYRAIVLAAPAGIRSAFNAVSL
jgi:hypothetical protein